MMNRTNKLTPTEKGERKMGFYHLDLDALADYTKIPVEKLKDKKYTELEYMIQEMNHAKFVKECNKNAQDEEYTRLVNKFFTPMSYLTHWFDKKEIVQACADIGITKRSLCEEQFTKPGTGKGYYEQYGEYLRTSMESVPQYDAHGRELMERKRERMDVYRMKNKYQGLCHGNVISHLLYKRYPELQQFDFQFYELYSYESDYKIYPSNGVYTPFAALMSGDVDWIIHRNREYCKLYNNGRYSQKECEKAFLTKDVKNMFYQICQIGRQEIQKKHFPFRFDESDSLIMANGLKEVSVSPSGNVWLVRPENKNEQHPDRTFKLVNIEPQTVAQMTEAVDSIFDHSAMDIRLCNMSDYLSGNPKTEELAKYADAIVTNTFGWRDEDGYHLILRADLDT